MVQYFPALHKFKQSTSNRTQPHPMIFKNRSHTMIYKNSHKKIPQERLHFPGKQDQDGYVGKKQFALKHLDRIVLRSPEGERIKKFDKLQTEQVEGAFPSLNLECERNVRNHKNKQYSQQKLKRIKTQEIPDSLQLLIQDKINKSRRLKSQVNPENSTRNKKQNLVATKEHIFGVFDRPQWNSQVNKKSIIANPTYLSSMQKDNW